MMKQCLILTEKSVKFLLSYKIYFCYRGTLATLTVLVPFLKIVCNLIYLVEGNKKTFQNP